MELATPGSAVRHASVARHVTDCATRPGMISLATYELLLFGFQNVNGFSSPPGMISLATYELLLFGFQNVNGFSSPQPLISKQ